MREAWWTDITRKTKQNLKLNWGCKTNGLVWNTIHYDKCYFTILLEIEIEIKI